MLRYDDIQPHIFIETATKNEAIPLEKNGDSWQWQATHPVKLRGVYFPPSNEFEIIVGCKLFYSRNLLKGIYLNFQPIVDTGVIVRVKPL